MSFFFFGCPIICAESASAGNFRRTMNHFFVFVFRCPIICAKSVSAGNYRRTMNSFPAVPSSVPKMLVQGIVGGQ